MLLDVTWDSKLFLTNFQNPVHIKRWKVFKKKYFVLKLRCDLKKNSTLYFILVQIHKTNLCVSKGRSARMYFLF